MPIYLLLQRKASFDEGYDGYVESKVANSKLLNYYISKIGAKYVGGYDFYLDTKKEKSY